MNKIVKEQLNKCREADLSNFDKESNTYYIKKKTSIRLLENHCYLVKLNQSIFDNSLLASNWNNNQLPPNEYLKIDISQIMGNMIKVNSIGFDFDNNIDLNKSWQGWLPSNEIEVISEIQ